MGRRADEVGVAKLVRIDVEHVGTRCSVEVFGQLDRWPTEQEAKGTSIGGRFGPRAGSSAGVRAEATGSVRVRSNVDIRVDVVIGISVGAWMGSRVGAGVSAILGDRVGTREGERVGTRALAGLADLDVTNGGWSAEVRSKWSASWSNSRMSELLMRSDDLSRVDGVAEVSNPPNESIIPMVEVVWSAAVEMDVVVPDVVCCIRRSRWSVSDAVSVFSMATSQRI